MCFQDVLHQHIIDGFIVHQRDYLAPLVQASAATSRPYEPDVHFTLQHKFAHCSPIRLVISDISKLLLQKLDLNVLHHNH